MGNTFHAVIHKCYRDQYSLSALYALAIGSHRYLGTFQLIDRFIAPTEFVKRKVIEGQIADPERITVLGNFLSSNDELPQPLFEREPYVVYLGRLSNEKGLISLIEAFRDLQGIQLKILGTGPLEKVISQIIEKDQLTNIRMMGFVKGHPKWLIIQRALATIIPSDCYETFSLTAIESMAYGTPVIAPDHGSLPCTVEDGLTGLIYQNGNLEDLRAKLRWLFVHPEQAEILGTRAQIVVKGKFFPQTHYEQLIRIYQEVIS
jgi:glycosyltransferase involved in cell wall biosynthesis